MRHSRSSAPLPSVGHPFARVLLQRRRSQWHVGGLFPTVPSIVIAFQHHHLFQLFDGAYSVAFPPFVSVSSQCRHNAPSARWGTAAVLPQLTLCPVDQLTYLRKTFLPFFMSHFSILTFLFAVVFIELPKKEVMLHDS